MVGKRQADSEGDLFPRGAGPNSTPRVRKRDGQTLFGPQLKRPRQVRPEATEASPETPVVQQGAALSISRLSVGMTVVGLVSKADHNGVQLVLPGGLRAVVPKDEILIEQSKGGIAIMDTGDESSSNSESESEEEDAPLPAWQLVNVGSMVRVSVVDISSNDGGRKSVAVSLKPHLVNVGLNPDRMLSKDCVVYGAVKSVEDHGYVITFGTNIPHTGFLPFESSPGDNGEKLLLGAPLLLVTVKETKPSKKKSKRSRAIGLSADHEKVINCVTDTTDMAIQDLQAGMLVKARIMQEGPGGLALLINGVIPVEADAAHVPRTADGSWDVKKGKKALVRLLYVDAARKKIGASLLQSMVVDLSPRKIPSQWRIGTLMKNLRVEQVKNGFGLVMSYVSSRDDLKGDAKHPVDGDIEMKSADVEDEAKSVDVDFQVPLFAHISRVADVKNVNLESMFKEGMIIDNGARVVSISKCDGLVNVDLRPSIISRKVLSIEEVEEGSIYSCKILSHTSLGSVVVAVDGDPYIPGIVHPSHISDVPIPSTRLSKHESFRIGSTIKCRVRAVKHEKGKIYMTARKSLVSPKYAILRSFDQAEAAIRKMRDDENTEKLDLFTGTILKVTEKGNVLVEFCGGVVALIPTSELSLDRGKDMSQTDIEDLYPVGDTIHVRLLKVDSKNRRLTASTRLHLEKKRGRRLLNLADIVCGSIDGWDADAKHFRVTVTRPASAEISGADKAVNKLDKRVEKVQCFLPVGHLADSVGLSDCLEISLRAKLSENMTGKTSGVVCSNAMVLMFRDNIPILTKKESLINAVAGKTLPQSFAGVEAMIKKSDQEGNVKLRGFVKVLLPSGVIVGFLGNSVGFVRKSRIADQFVSDPARFLKLNQSVHVVVDSIDQLKQRFLLSMRVSDVGSKGLEEDTISLFKTAREWQEFLDISNTEKEFPIGSVIDATITGTTSYGVKYKLRNEKSTISGVSFGSEGGEEDPVRSDVNSEASGEKQEPAPGKASTNKKSTATGKEHRVRILDVDFFNTVADVSRDADLVSAGERKSVLADGTSYNAEVLLVKSTYIILAVRRSASRSAIGFALAPAVQDQLLIRPGLKLSCHSINKPRGLTKRNLVIVDWQSSPGMEKKLSNMQSNGEERYSSYEMIRNLAPQEESAIVGMQITGKVTKKFPLQAFVGVAPGIVGRIHISSTHSQSKEGIEKCKLGLAPKDVASQYNLPEAGKQVKPAYIVGVRRRGDTEGSPVVLELSLVREVVKGNFSEGDVLLGFVQRLSSRFAANNTEQSTTRTLVSLNSTAVAACADVDCLFDDDDVKLTAGSPVICQITQVKKNPEDGTARIQCSLSENGKGSDFFRGIVHQVIPGHGLKVAIPWSARDPEAKTVLWGTVDVCEVSDNFDNTEKRMKELKAGDVVKVKKLPLIQKCTPEDKVQFALTMRGILEGQEVKDPLVSLDDIASLQKGQAVRGFVRGVSKKGCFVSIGRGVSAQVKLHDLDDEFVKDPMASFPVGKLVSGTIDRINTSSKKVEVSLVLRKRPRKILNTDGVPLDIKEGSKVKGKIQRVERYGAIVEMANGAKALLHKTEVDQDRFIRDTTEEWVVGQKLTAIVISAENGKIKLGTKRCYFEAAGMDDEAVEDALTQNESAKLTEQKGEADDIEMTEVNADLGDTKLESGGITFVEQGSDSEPDSGTKGDEGDGAENEDDSAMEVANVAVKSDVAPLVVSRGFDFSESSVPTATEESEDPQNTKGEAEDSSEGVEVGQKQSREKRERKKQRQAAEKEIRLREQALADNPDSPETAQDYERLLLGQPNSSVLWIRYMAFCLQLSQVDKARSIAERALETISLEAESERTNLWCAYINLEAQYGSLNSTSVSSENGPDSRRTAAVMKLFQRACERVTDVEGFHVQIASALRKGFPDLASDVLRRATKKFRESPDVWIATGQMKFSSGKIAEGRKTLERALSSLEKGQHIPIISKFAQFEYKHGSAERGRTVFASLVGNFPKRVDLWNIYLDMELCECNKAAKEDEEEQVQRTRQVLQRFADLDLSSKKMKFAFTKWLRFEKGHGTKESQRIVKDRARAYVERVGPKKH